MIDSKIILTRAEWLYSGADVPWIAEPQLRYQLELELVSGMSESINPGIRQDIYATAQQRGYHNVEDWPT